MKRNKVDIFIGDPRLCESSKIPKGIEMTDDRSIHTLDQLDRGHSHFLRLIYHRDPDF